MRVECYTPEQSILASNDEAFCVPPHLKYFFVTFLSSGLGDMNKFVFSMSNGLNGKVRSKEKAYHVLKEVFSSDLFSQTALGKLCTHSIRKLPSTYARRNGCGRDNIDCRDRWKKAKRLVDTFVDIDLPYPDANEASSILSICGPIKYSVREESNVSDLFILEYVSPHLSIAN